MGGERAGLSFGVCIRERPRRDIDTGSASISTGIESGSVLISSGQVTFKCHLLRQHTLWCV